jgi:hypothetical protein
MKVHDMSMQALSICSGSAPMGDQMRAKGRDSRRVLAFGDKHHPALGLVSRQRHIVVPATLAVPRTATAGRRDGGALPRRGMRRAPRWRDFTCESVMRWLAGLKRPSEQPPASLTKTPPQERTTMAVTFTHISAFAAALVAPAAPGGAQPPPVAIDQCIVTTNVYYPFVAHGNLRWLTTSGLRIVFHDRAAQRASAIRFLVNYRGDVETIDDAGTFAPGVEVNHSYQQFVDFAYLGTRPNFCRVLSVKFADGTTWTRETAQPQAR